jgi:leader peptidase (prepilin peptidase)/N-methyltransferase
VFVAVVQGGWGRLGVAAAVAAVAEAVFGVWAFCRPGSLGFGDVRLIGLVGLGVGWVAPVLVPVALAVAMVAAGIVGVVGVAAGRLSWGSRLPLGSFLAGAGVVMVIVMRT